MYLCTLVVSVFFAYENEFFYKAYKNSVLLLSDFMKREKFQEVFPNASIALAKSGLTYLEKQVILTTS